jgi:hypothetical protein
VGCLATEAQHTGQPTVTTFTGQGQPRNARALTNGDPAGERLGVRESLLDRLFEPGTWPPRASPIAWADRRRRIDDPVDWVRREIAEALSLGLRGIPVLTGDASLPAEADLPQDIAGHAYRTAAGSSGYWRYGGDFRDRWHCRCG